MKVSRTEITDKNGKQRFIYKYDDGTFASKKLWEEQQAIIPKPKRKTPRPAVEIIAEMDKKEEWVGESGVYVCGVDPVIESSVEEKIQKDIAEFERELDAAIEEATVVKKEEPVEVKSKGFFSSWFKLWNW